MRKIDGGKKYPGTGVGAGCNDMCSSDSDCPAGCGVIPDQTIANVYDV